MVSLIQALTPSSLSADKFRMTRTESDDFREYANEFDGSVFREFEIEFVSSDEPGPRDADVVLTETECEIVMAYPHHWAAYAHAQTSGTRWNAEAMRAIALEDRRLIIDEVGRTNAANLVAGQHASVEGEVTIDDEGEGVSFLVIPMTLTYYEQA